MINTLIQVETLTDFLPCKIARTALLSLQCQNDYCRVDILCTTFAKNVRLENKNTQEKTPFGGKLMARCYLCEFQLPVCLASVVEVHRSTPIIN